MVVDRSSVVACVLLVGRRRAAGKGGDACACPATLVRLRTCTGRHARDLPRGAVAFPHGSVAFSNDVSILAARHAARVDLR